MLTFKEHIVKVKDQFRLVSKKTGKNLGTYPTREGAEKRERQVQYFKHVNEDVSHDDYSEFMCEATNSGLTKKAEKSGVSLSTLQTVYRRGIAAWNSGHRPGTTPQQWAMARVNSYITKGKGTYGGADKDLHEDSTETKDSRLGNKAYSKGLNDSTAKARVTHWKKMDKLSDSDPRAYEPAPGDATAKTKTSKHTLKYRAMYGESMDEEILEACWVGYKQVGVKKKGNKMVPNCVPEDVNYMFDELIEATKSIDSGEYDYEGQMARTQLQTILRNSKDMIDMLSDQDNMPEWVQSKITLAQDYISCVRDYLQSKEELGESELKSGQKKLDKNHNGKLDSQDFILLRNKKKDIEEQLKGGQKKLDKNHNGKLDSQDFMMLRGKKTNKEIEEQFDMIEEVIEELALIENIDSDKLWETLEDVSDEELLEYAIDAKGYKSSTGGLTQKGVDAYNAKTGGNLKTAVTTPPSKLKPGSKAANRRKSFCARMGGMPGAMKDEKGEPTRKALSLRKWNC